jgi:hypothetical protein
VVKIHPVTLDRASVSENAYAASYFNSAHPAPLLTSKRNRWVLSVEDLAQRGIPPISFFFIMILFQPCESGVYEKSTCIVSD